MCLCCRIAVWLCDRVVVLLRGCFCVFHVIVFAFVCLRVGVLVCFVCLCVCLASCVCLCVFVCVNVCVGLGVCWCVFVYV